MDYRVDDEVRVVHGRLLFTLTVYGRILKLKMMRGARLFSGLLRTSHHRKFTVDARNLMFEALKDRQAGSYFGGTFEINIRGLLSSCGYENLLTTSGNSIEAVIMSSPKKVAHAEFDAIVIGGQLKMYQNFEGSFLLSYAKYPPQKEDHALLVEVKLNSDGLETWLESNSGSSRVFLNSSIGITKVVVINGGEESRSFIHGLKCPVSSRNEEKFASLKEKIDQHRINIFYKPWSSGETFLEVLKENSEIKTENAEIKTENAEIKTENAEIKTENAEIKTENAEIKTENAEIKTENAEIKLRLKLLEDKFNAK